MQSTNQTTCEEAILHDISSSSIDRSNDYMCPHRELFIIWLLFSNAPKISSKYFQTDIHVDHIILASSRISFLERTNDVDVEIVSKKNKFDKKASSADECDVQSAVLTSANNFNQQFLHELEEKIVASVETKCDELKRITGKFCLAGTFIPSQSSEIFHALIHRWRNLQVILCSVGILCTIFNSVDGLQSLGVWLKRSFLSRRSWTTSTWWFYHEKHPVGFFYQRHAYFWPRMNLRMVIFLISVSIKKVEFRFHTTQCSNQKVRKHTRIMSSPSIMTFSPLEAVRVRFAFKEDDMGNIRSSIRTSLVQIVTDICKETKRKAQVKQTTSTQPIASSEKRSDGNNGSAMNEWWQVTAEGQLFCTMPPSRPFIPVRNGSSI